MKMIVEKEKKLPVLYDGYDIVVTGGGIAGVAAALAAAREGRKVLLIERMFGLGGLATLGLVTIYLPLCDGIGHQVSYGIAEELLHLAIQHGWERDYPDTWIPEKTEHGTQRFQVRFNAQVFAAVLERQLQKDGVDLLYGTTICQVIRKENKIEALIVENKDGRSAIPVQGVVDASGDADIFKLAGARTEVFQEGNKLAAWYYETLDGKNTLHMLGASDVLPEDGDSEAPDMLEAKRISGLDAREITEWLLKGHAFSLEKFLEKGNVSETHSFSTTATIPQLRMTRRICGTYTLDEKEAFSPASDSIGMIGDWRKRGPVYEIPMRTLYDAELHNVVAAGRCISVTDAMWDITRVIPAAAVTGQAAGTMLALFADVTQLNVSRLQEKLKENGVKLHVSEVL